MPGGIEPLHIRGVWLRRRLRRATFVSNPIFRPVADKTAPIFVLANRHPEGRLGSRGMFSKGLQPKDLTRTDLAEAVRTGGHSAYVVGTRDLAAFLGGGQAAKKFAYVVTQAPGSIPLPQGFGVGQGVAYRRPIEGRHIQGAYQLRSDGRLGKWYTNWAYVGLRSQPPTRGSASGQRAGWQPDKIDGYAVLYPQHESLTRGTALPPEGWTLVQELGPRLDMPVSRYLMHQEESKEGLGDGSAVKGWIALPDRSVLTPRAGSRFWAATT